MLKDLLKILVDVRHVVSAKYFCRSIESISYCVWPIIKSREVETHYVPDILNSMPSKCVIALINIINFLKYLNSQENNYEYI